MFYSYGHPNGVMPYFSGPSLDRKPGPYNLFIAAAQLDLDLARSWMVGDRETDVDCAQAAGVRPILVENANYSICRSAGVIGAANFAAAAAIIAEAGCGELVLGAAEMRATQA